MNVYAVNNINLSVVSLVGNKAGKLYLHIVYCQIRFMQISIYFSKYMAIHDNIKQKSTTRTPSLVSDDDITLTAWRESSQVELSQQTVDTP